MSSLAHKTVVILGGTTGIGLATASCGAVEAFARSLAIDLALIRVNTLQPGYVDTPMLDERRSRRRRVRACS